MAVTTAAGGASPNTEQASILAEDEYDVNVSPRMPDPPLEHWENMARIAGAPMKDWAERVNPDEPLQSRSEPLSR